MSAAHDGPPTHGSIPHNVDMVLIPASSLLTLRHFLRRIESSPEFWGEKGTLVPIRIEYESARAALAKPEIRVMFPAPDWI